MGDEELASGTSSAGHVLASLWLVSQSSQEVFLVIVLRDLILWPASPKASCFLFLSKFVVQYGCTVGMVVSVIICGYSFCKRLQVDMQAGTDARMRPSFKLEETAWVQMLGKGGKTIGDFVRCDIPVIQRYRLDILILLLGDNDTGCDTSAEEIANHLIALASQLYMGGHTSRIVLW